MVTARGEFAVRGGIVDIFPPTAEHPVRVEFWGDEVSELRAFTVADQRSTHPVDELDAPRLPRAAAHRPRPRAGRRARPHAREQPAAARAAGAPGPGHPGRGHGVAHPGAGRGRAAAAHRPAARAARRCCVADPERVRTRSADLVRTGQEFLEASAGSPRAWAAAPRSTSARRPTATSATCSSTPPATGHPVRHAQPAALAAATTRSSRAPHEVDGLPRRHRPRAGRPARPRRHRRRRRARGRRPRHRAARDGAAPRGRGARRARRRAAGRAGEGPGHRHLRADRGGLHRAGVLVVLTEADLTGNRRGDAPRPASSPSRRRNAVDLVTLKPGDYVVHAQHGIGRFVEMRAAHRAGRHPRVPGAGVRVVQARPARRPAVRAHRRARRGEPLRRRRGAHAQQARRRRLGEDEGPRAQGRPADRGPARAALRRPPGRARLRVRQGHAVAARAGGRVPVHRDARPAGRDRRGQGRHGAPGPDGPGDLRRRRLRQDRDRGAGGVQGGAGRQAGGGARADHAARQQHLETFSERMRAFPVTVRGCRGSPTPPRPARRSRAWPTARSTSSSAPTGCCRPGCGGRTSGW